MPKDSFKALAVSKDHPRWEALTSRPKPLYARGDDIRSPFSRDYTRILHSTAYRRLKHKTQVFYNIGNDHICTRMEHVHHVESVSVTIAQNLGLNVELTRAIAIGHDLGHAPFGHYGETVISRLAKKHLKDRFWHEKNGLRFVDKLELLKDPYDVCRNLCLTYAVRDGIISHCGEVNEHGLFPREELFDLDAFTAPGQYQPATWEGCVVKLADKIAYLGRDIEDALTLGFLDESAKRKLLKMARRYDEKAVNTTVVMHNFITDVCDYSSPETGIGLSPACREQMDELKAFNEKHIYRHRRFEPFKKYAGLVINQLFETLRASYKGKNTIAALRENLAFAPLLLQTFTEWLACYCEPDILPEGELKNKASRCDNEKIYEDLSTKELYIQAILDFIAGMTDRFAIEVFDELITY